MSRRSTLLDLGGFNAELKSGSDWKLSRRIQAMGQPIIYISAMLVGHPLRGSLEKLMARQRRLTGGLWQDTKIRWKFLWCAAVLIRRFASRMKITLLDGRLSLADKLKVSGIVVTLSAIAMVELVHLARGGEPRRA